MLQEAVDELFGFQRAAAFLPRIGIPVAKRHAVILQLQDAIIANGHPEDVRGQIFQGAQAGTHVFAMHDPLLLPDLGRNVPEAIGGLQSLAKFGTEDPGKGSHGEQEVVPGREPGLSILG